MAIGRTHLQGAWRADLPISSAGREPCKSTLPLPAPNGSQVTEYPIVRLRSGSASTGLSKRPIESLTVCCHRPAPAPRCAASTQPRPPFGWGNTGQRLGLDLASSTGHAVPAHAQPSAVRRHLRSTQSSAGTRRFRFRCWPESVPAARPSTGRIAGWPAAGVEPDCTVSPVPTFQRDERGLW
jgi:hypothetical protein